MKTYTAFVERDKETGLFVGCVPGFPGAHTQGTTLEELRLNLQEVIEMLLEDHTPPSNTVFIAAEHITIVREEQRNHRSMF